MDARNPAARRARTALLLAAVACCLTPSACVRRSMTITTEPAQALVFVNGEEVGRSELTTDFLWYGDYDITIRKEGYQTLQTNWRIKEPWYQVIPLDFFFEVLWPGRLHDGRSRHFVLEPQVAPDVEALAARAEELRSRTIPFSK